MSAFLAPLPPQPRRFYLVETPTACASTPSKRHGLCAASLRTLRETYEQRNAYPQSSGCAHALGRVSEATLENAIRDITTALNGDASRATLHFDAGNCGVYLLNLIGARRGDEIVLSIKDDPNFVVPIRSAALQRDLRIRWITRTTLPDIVRTVTARTRLLALQAPSPLSLTSPALDAIKYVRSAGVTVLLDATHSLAAGASLDNLSADIIVAGGSSIRAHPGAAVAMWEARSWTRLNPARDACQCIDTAAAASFAASVTATRQFIGPANAALTDTLNNELCILPSCTTVIPDADSPLKIPVTAIRVINRAGGSIARRVARRLWSVLPDDAAMVRIRVLPPFSERCRAKRVVRDELLCMEFSAIVHDAGDVQRLVHGIDEQVRQCCEDNAEVP